MRRFKFSLLDISIALLWCLLGILAANVAASAQANVSRGRHFVVAFPDTTIASVPVIEGRWTNISPFANGAKLIFFSERTARVTITSPGYVRNITVQPGFSTTVDLFDRAPSASPVFVTAANTTSTGVFTVQSDEPVTVYGYFITKDGGEAFTPLPVESWGTSYVAVTRSNTNITALPAFADESLFDTRQVDAPSQLIVVASENNTRVTITSPANIDGQNPRTVTLAAGSAYMVQGRAGGTRPSDLSGTRITADKPIGVLSGNTRTATRIPTVSNQAFSGSHTNNSLLNTTVEWLRPIEMGGTLFLCAPVSSVTIPYDRRDDTQPVDRVRVYGISGGTTTVTDLASGARRTVTEGNYIEYSTTANGSNLPPLALQTDKPAQVTLWTGSHLRNTMAEFGDEFDAWASAQSDVMPREAWVVSARFHAPGTPATLRHWIAIVADSGARVRLDGAPVTLRSAGTNGATRRFGYALVSVSAGDHMIESASGTFSATAYGLTRGGETYRPGERKDGGDDSQLLHPSIYSLSMSIAYAYPVLGAAGGISADSLQFSCLDSTASLVIRNPTSSPVRIDWLGIEGDSTGSFSVPPSVSMTIPSLGTGQVPVMFDPRSSGTFTATGVMLIRDEAGTVIDTLRAPMIGTATVLRAKLERELTLPPGRVDIPVILETPLDSEKLESLTVTLRFDSRMLILATDAPDPITRGTLLQGWTMVVTKSKGDTVVLSFTAPLGATLKGTGVLLRLPVSAFIGPVDSSEIVCAIGAPGRFCARTKIEPGKVRLSICGLSFRLMEVFEAYALKPNQPNPFNPTTEIEFDLGMDGWTTLTVYDAAGNRVETLVDEHLQPGSYTYTWNASEYPSGAYYYRLTSGAWSRTGRMSLAK